MLKRLNKSEPPYYLVVSFTKDLKGDILNDQTIIDKICRV